MMRRTVLAAAVALQPAPGLGQTTLRDFGRGSWAALLAAKAGRPAIFHFWGLTCAPCLAELPEWGRLTRERPDATLVAIAADPAPQPRARLAGAIAKAGLDLAEHWTFDGTFSARLYFEVDPAWRGELPRTTLVPAAGAPEHVLGTADFNRIRAWLDRQRA